MTAQQAAPLAMNGQVIRTRAAGFYAVLAIAIVLFGAVISGCGSDSTPTEALKDRTAEPGYGETKCPPTSGATQTIEFKDAFQKCIDTSKTYIAVVDTSEGTVKFKLDTKRTPITTNNFVALARYGYYDDTSIFRIEANSGIIQGGSPHTQNAADPGPGYTIPDEALPFSSKDYGPGALAMARTASPNSASAQFFFLANEGGRYLGDTNILSSSAGTYVVFGNVTEGLETLKAIAALDGGSGGPTKIVKLNKVTIEES